MPKQKPRFDILTQRAIPTLTIGGQIIVALKLPGRGLLINLCAQPFRFYSSWKAYKQAWQSGMLITTIIMTIVLSAGTINYLFL